jgi:hypothetical protein
MSGGIGRWAVLGLMAAGLSPARGEEAPKETVRYVRPAKGGFATECTFVIARDGKGWTITSRTDRGAVEMQVEARYDAEDRLTSARAALTGDGKTTTATVTLKGDKATVTRQGQQPQQFDVPKGTIVTSAPDWTDVFLLCRRCDPGRKGKQEFPALWIHPTQPAQRLTFSIERQGTDVTEHDGKKQELGRYRIHIRNNSAYAAWTDARGRMVRLIPLPAKGTTAGLTLEGYEKSAAGLRPPR